MNDVTTVKPSRRPAARPARAAEGPTLITEQQVMFATAAAAGLPQVGPRRWVEALGTVVHRVFAGRPAPQNHLRRYAYLENALMSREMYRL